MKFYIYNMNTDFWIEKAWSESVDDATIDDAKTTIDEIITKSGQHAIFWLGHTEKEYVLEIRNNLDLLFIYGKNQDKKIKIELVTWDECLHFIKMYFNGEFTLIKEEIKIKTFLSDLINARES